jgi:hypothetical protein
MRLCGVSVRPNQAKLNGDHQVLNQRIAVTLALVASPVLITSCSSGGLSEEGRAFVVDACSDLYLKDWNETSIDDMASYKNDFNELRNRSASLGAETSEVMSRLADEAAKLTELRNEWIVAMPTFALDDLDEVERVTNEFREGQTAVGQSINEICAPFFE